MVGTCSVLSAFLTPDWFHQELVAAGETNFSDLTDPWEPTPLKRAMIDMPSVAAMAVANDDEWQRHLLENDDLREAALRETDDSKALSAYYKRNRLGAWINKILSSTSSSDMMFDRC